ncbi:MFS transporter [Actinacidiphila yanglinensis]|nr:MFS transporter [Actinacidiphila yanglinensis]
MLPRLLRDAPLRRYWTASTVSMLGDGVTALAIPLTAAVMLHAGPTQMGLLNAAALAPGLFTLHLGALADRGGRRRVLMIGSDLCAFVLLASLPVCRALGVLTLGQLYAVVCALGLCSVLFTVCDGSLFASLVDRTRYVEGQSLRGVRRVDGARGGGPPPRAGAGRRRDRRECGAARHHRDRGPARSRMNGGGAPLPPPRPEMIRCTPGLTRAMGRPSLTPGSYCRSLFMYVTV